MSIPKEPRQLMINLMYLVLTAMLALNVSAEVINAFFKLDHSLEATNEIVDKSNDGVMDAMRLAVEERPNDKIYLDAASKVRDLMARYDSYIATLNGELELKAGGLFYATKEEAEAAEKGSYTTDKKKVGKPVKYKDKEIPQRLFVDGNIEGRGGEEPYEPKGPALKQKIMDTRDSLIAIVKAVQTQSKIMPDSEVEDLVSKLSISIDDEEWKEAGKDSWEQHTFGYMPVAACYPLLEKFRTDGKNSEATVINYLASKIAGTVVEFNTFEPVASAEKGYVIKGEKYKAEIFLSAYSDQAQISVNVNGSRLPVKDGKATYTATASSYGEKSYNVSIGLTNPFTGESQSFKKTFKYEVGERSAAIQLDKMNVFYIGVDNPISVSVAGVSSGDVRLSGSGGLTITPNGSGKYIVKASRPTNDASITVTGGPLSKKFDFRVKRIPDPIPRLGNKDGGNINAGEFRAQAGVAAWLDNFDFEARCNIQGYEVTRVPRRQDPVNRQNRGPRFTGEVQTIVGMAKAGDIYYIDNIKAVCPGDAAARKLPDLVFKIR